MLRGAEPRPTTSHRTEPQAETSKMEQTQMATSEWSRGTTHVGRFRSFTLLG